MIRPRAIVIGAAASLALAACSPHKVTENPKPPVEIPAQWGSTNAGKLPEQWWRDFRDPDLDKLVERSLRDNLQLRAAWARVRQARSLTRQARSGKFPQLDANLSGSRRRLRFDFGDMGYQRMIRDKGWVDAAAAAGNPKPTYPADAPTRRAGSIFYRHAPYFKIVDARVLNEPNTSDHRPLMVVLDYNPQTKQAPSASQATPTGARGRTE